MLTRVRIQNFRAIEDLTLELEPFQVLIGENNSGKTSFLDALVALQRVSDLGPIDAWKDPRFDFSRTVRLNASGHEIRWELETSTGLQYLLAVGKRDAQKKVGLLEEALTSDTSSFRRVWSQPEGQPEKMAYEVQQPGLVDVGTTVLQLTRANSELREFLRSMHLYILEPWRMVLPASPGATLKLRGEGFPGFLDRLQNNAPEAFEALQQHVRDIFPSVRFVRTPATEVGERELAVVEKGTSRPIYGSQLSDGLLLLIGYLAITLSPTESPSVLMLDEPEMGLHMARSGFLVELLRDLSAGRFGRPVQVIITTHSPDVVDFLKPEEVVVFERDERGVRAERLADVKDLKQRLRGYNLGEYWSSYGESGLLRGGEG